MLVLDNEAVPQTLDLIIPVPGKGLPRYFLSAEQCVPRSHVVLSTGTFATGSERE